MTGKLARGLALIAAATALGSAPTAAEERLTSSARFTGVTELVVEFSSVDIEARAGGPALSLERVGVPGDIPIMMERSGSTLRLVQRRRWLFLPPNDSGMVRIALPQGILVRLSSSSGELSLEGLAARRIAASTSSGDMAIRDCAGELELRSTSGEIEVTRHEGGFSIDTSSGKVTMESVAGSGAISTTSGGMRLLRLEGRLDCSSSSGDIEGREVRLRGDSTFETSSGSIRLGFRNPATELRFELSGTSGSLEALGTRGERRLAAGSGAIRVRGSSSSGSQSYTLD